MRLSNISEAITSKGVKSSVAVVINGAGDVLMGRSTDGDSRRGKWCFPGGGIKDATVERAAERECMEEAGVQCRAVRVMAYGSPDGAIPSSVAFVLCACDGGDPTPNHEFSEMAWMRPGTALGKPDIFVPNKWILTHIASGGLQESVSRETVLSTFAKAVQEQLPGIRVVSRADGSINLFSGRKGLSASEREGKIVLSSAARGLISAYDDPIEAMAVAIKSLS